MSAVSDPIGDFLTRLRNASRAGKDIVEVPHSKLKVELSKILKKEGFIRDFELTGEGVQKAIRIQTKFVEKTPAITGLKRVSRPGLRRYVGSQEIPRVLGGMGISILSTSHGIITGREARRQNVGGELLAFVW
jgi:small subunit ribosomal protein S8